MYFLGKIDRFSFNKNLIIDLEKNGRIYKAIFPANFSLYFHDLDRLTSVALIGNFSIDFFTIFYNKTITVKIMKNIVNENETLIENIKPNGRYNVFCMVTKFLPSIETNGTDYVASLYVTDESIAKNFKIQIFTSYRLNGNEYSFGDIIKIENLFMNKSNFAIADRNFPINIISNIHQSENEKTLDKNDRLKIDRLKQHFLDNKNVFMSYIELKNLKENIFFDFIGILKEKRQENSRLILLYFIDYTENPLIPKDEDGMSVLCVKVWDQFALEAIELDIGRIYIIKNIKSIIYNSVLAAQMSNSSKGEFIFLNKNDPLALFLQNNKRVFELAYHKAPDSSKFKYFESKKMQNIISEKRIGFFHTQLCIKQILGVPYSIFVTDNYCKCKKENEQIENDLICNFCNKKILEGCILLANDDGINTHQVLAVGKFRNPQIFIKIIKDRIKIDCLLFYDINNANQVIFLADIDKQIVA